jgi:diguanylate cyclase (GGDEF)-like protein
VIQAVPDGPASPEIVLIEDNPGDARLVLEMLRDVWGDALRFTHFSSMAASRQNLPAAGEACVLLDLSLPDAEGLEAVSEMALLAPDLPVVVLTGRDDETLALEAVHEGAQDYLIKGRVDGTLLGRTIRYAVERKRVETELAHQALHDPLTGLPNRALFLDRLGLALLRSERRPLSVAVLFLDLDRFKVINDGLGHEAGDQLLRAAADRITGVLRPEDTVARFGGDEFTILCEDLGGERDITLIAERIGAALAPAFELTHGEIFVTASIGIALATESHQSPDELVRDADAAMYRAKERGKARYELFDEAMHTRAVRRLDTENALHRAVERGEFRLHYQPEVDVESGQIVGVEALIRWEHPERGLVNPLEFIAVAEDTGLIVPIGNWVLEESCRQARAWRSAHPDLPPLLACVNLSARQLGRPDLVDSIARILEETGTNPGDLCLEITESVLMEDVESTLGALSALKTLGVKLSVDDFGTGYSSLSYLKRFPVSLLKVDKSFIDGLGRDTEDTAIVEAVIGLAHALGLTAVAEGVETKEQLAHLNILGCDLYQGYYFSRPRPAEELASLLARRRPTGH